MAQFLRPDSNVTQTNWTGGFADIDEATASDADFAYGANNSSSATLEVGLSNPSTPAGGTCTVRWRYAKVDAGTLSGTGGTVTQTCGLYQGTTLITSSAVTTTGTWTAASFTFQVTAITNWNDLRLRWTQTASGGGGNARGSAVSWAEVETPNAAQAITMPADAGSFNEAGQDAGTLYNRNTAGGLASFNEQGQDVNFLRTYQLLGDTGSFNEQGQDATLRKNTPLLADTGLYNEAGQDVGLLRGLNVAAGTGAFNEAGQPAGLLRTYTVAANTGSFTTTGQPAGTLYGRTVIAASQTYTVTGQPAGSLQTYSLAANSQSYALTGQAATLRAALRGVSETGNFSVTGQLVDLFKGIPVIGGLGQFIASFVPADLRRSYSLPADAGIYAFTGNASILQYSPVISAGTYAASLTGNPVNLRLSIAAAQWAPNTSYPLGYLVRATTLLGTGLIFKSLNAGTSGATEPAWPGLLGNQTLDNNITWEAVSLVSGSLQVANPSAIIELFELRLVPELHGSGDVYRFHAGSNALQSHGDVVWAGNSYTRFPVEAEGFEYGGTGQLPRPTIRVSNILSTVSAILASINQAMPGSDLTGAKVIRIRTLAKYLDDVNFEGGTNPYGVPDPYAEFPREIYYVDRKSAENNQLVEFELASSLDLAGVLAPKRQTIANICQWRYRRWNSSTSTFDYTKVDCPYNKSLYFKADGTPTNNPAEDVCDKRLTSCKLRFDTAFVTGNVTVGSTTMSSLSTSELFRINIGDEIKGFGLPAGTTVATKSASALTLSQASQGTTSVTTTGTRSSLGLFITVASTTGLLPGMTVSGSQIPAGTKISSIDTVNKYVYLNITINPLIYLFTSFVTGTLLRVSGIDYVQLPSVSGITANSYVEGAGIYQNTFVSGTNLFLNRITLDRLQTIDEGLTKTVSIRIGTLQAAAPASYTFTASDLYTIRPDAIIPFGSFPAVGTIR